MSASAKTTTARKLAKVAPAAVPAAAPAAVPAPQAPTPSPLTRAEFERQRGFRQSGLVPETLATMDCVVMGVGAVGRQVALALTQLGAPRLILVDHDRVEAVNLATQGYAPDQIGQSKPEATARDCQRLNPWLELEVRPQMVETQEVRPLLVPRTGRPLVYFACVDSIAVRGWILEQAVALKAAVVLDARMLAEQVRVLRTSPGAPHYPTTLFAASEAQTGSCRDRAAGYAATLAANMLVYLFVRWLRGDTHEADLYLNLPGLEMFSDPDLENRHAAQEVGREAETPAPAAG